VGGKVSGAIAIQGAELVLNVPEEEKYGNE
jgi:hypothetical protein